MIASVILIVAGFIIAMLVFGLWIIAELRREVSRLLRGLPGSGIRGVVDDGTQLTTFTGKRAPFNVYRPPVASQLDNAPPPDFDPLNLPLPSTHWDMGGEAHMKYLAYEEIIREPGRFSDADYDEAVNYFDMMR